MMMVLPELVPSPLRGVSAYRLLSRSKWNVIRSVVIVESNYTCAHCGDRREKGMTCHEVWEYDDVQGTANLVNLGIICTSCGNVHHIGQATTRGYYAEALAHLMRTNNQTKAAAERIIDDA